MNQTGEIRTDAFGRWCVEGESKTLLNYLGGEKRVMLPPDCTGIGSYAFTGTDVEEAMLHSGIETVAPYAFSGCKKLKKVVLPERLQRVEEGTFFGCRRLETVAVPSALRYIGDSAFEGCMALKEMHFPGTLAMIGGRAFQNSGLEEVRLGSLAVLGGGAFRFCRGLKRATVRAEWMYQSAFADCGALENLELEQGVMSIGEDAFNGCESLREVRIPGSVYELGCRAFRNIPGLTVYIPDALRDHVEHYRCFDMMEPEEVRFFESDATIYYDGKGGV